MSPLDVLGVGALQTVGVVVAGAAVVVVVGAVVVAVGVVVAGAAVVVAVGVVVVAVDTVVSELPPHPDATNKSASATACLRMAPLCHLSYEGG